MEVQPQLILLQKTLLAIEGLGRQLYPELDLWATAKPFLEKWVREQMGPKAFIKRLKQNLPFFTEQLPHMPKLIFDILEMKKDQLLTVHEFTRLQSENNNQTIQWKSVGLGVFFSFLSLGVISYFDLLDYNHLTTITIAGSVLAGIFVLINRKIRN